MTDKKVKILKKAEVRPKPAKKGSTNPSRLAAREMVSTVSEWVSEFKARRTEETRVAFDTLFSSRPHPNES